MFENVVRSLYWMVPPGDREGFGEQRSLYRALRDAPGGSAVRLSNVGGIPFVAVLSDTLPRIDEPVLVFVDAGQFGAGEVRSLLERNGVRSDVFVVARGGAPE